MITKIELKNWKSFAHSTLHIDPLTFVIGVNASGKSNLLDAFSCLSKLAQSRRIDEVIDSIRGGKDWLIRDGQTTASLTVFLKENRNTIKYTIKFFNYKGQIEVTEEELWQNEKKLFWTNSPQKGTPTIDIRFHTAKQGRAKKIELGRNTTVLSQIDTLNVLAETKKYTSITIEHLRNIFILNPIPNNMRGYTALSTDLKEDASNIAGVLAGLGEQKDTIEKSLSGYLKNLPEHDIKRVWTETVGRFNSDAMLYCKEQWKPQHSSIIDARGMSDGTLRFLAIVTALQTLKPKSLLIIEEVDNGLHPSRAKELVTMLKELSQQKQVDVLCTTHNPVLLDELGTDMLPFISYIKRDVQTGGSHVELLEEKENLAKLMAQHTMGGLMVEDCL